MNHIYIGLGELGKQALLDFYKHYEEASLDQSTQLHAEFLAVTESEPQDLFIFDSAAISNADFKERFHTIKINEPSIKNALMYLREHNWLKIDAQEQTYWSELIAEGVSTGMEKLPRRLIRLNLASVLEQLLYHVHETYLRLQRKYDDEGLSLHLVVDSSQLWVNAILMDVIVHLRQHYPSLFCRLSVYVLLPERFSFHKLSDDLSVSLYATLVEFRALMNNAWMPENLLNILPLSEDGNWVHASYLIEHDTEERSNKGLSALLLRKSLVKEELWHEAFFDTEEAASPTDEVIQKDSFVSFGLLRLAVSVDYPTEYYKKLFAVQLLNALLFRHWQDDKGYVPFKQQRDGETGVLQEFIDEWCLDVDYLTLNKLMTNDQSKLHPKWTSIELDWQRNRQERLEAIDELPAAQRPTALVQKYMDYYHERFRLKGVKHFYQQEWPESRVEGLAFKIVSGIEKTLISLWWSDDKGINDLPLIIQDIQTYLQNQLLQLQQQGREHDQRAEEYLELYQQVLAQAQEQNDKKRLFGSNPAATASLQQLDDYLYVAFTERTYLSSIGFAERLIARLQLKLTALFEQISDIIANLVQIRDGHDKVLQQIEQVSSQGTWVAHEADTHMLQVSLNVHLETEKIRSQIMAQPFEIKNFVQRFKGQLRQLFSQQVNFNAFNEYVSKQEFQSSLIKITEAYANHLDYLLSGKEKRPETRELISATIQKTPGAKIEQFVHFLQEIGVQPHCGKLPSNQGIPAHSIKTNGKLFVPTWVREVNAKPVLMQMLKMNHLKGSDLVVQPNLNNYLDLINICHLDLKEWPAVKHLAAVYQQKLHQYSDIKRSYFQWHTEYRLCDWLEHGWIEPKFEACQIRTILIKAYAQSLIQMDIKATDIQISAKRDGHLLTDGFVSLADVLQLIKMSDLMALDREIQATPMSKALPEACERRLKSLLDQLKHAFFELDSEADNEWSSVGAFVAWQRSIQEELAEFA